MVNNGSFHYDHDRDGTHTALDGCEAQFREAKHETFVAIRYERNRLMVSGEYSCPGRFFAMCCSSLLSLIASCHPRVILK